MKIKVTQQDIDKGGEYSPETCPVARAIGRAINVRSSRYRVQVGTDNVEVYSPKFGKRLMTRKLPEDAQAFIRRFDLKLSAVPFSFTIRGLEKLIPETRNEVSSP